MDSKKPSDMDTASSLSSAEIGDQVQSKLQTVWSKVGEYLQVPVFVLGCLTLCYLIGYFGFSILGLLVFGVVFVKYYNRRVRKFSYLAMKRLEREIKREKYDGHFESVEWINLVLFRMWAVYEPALSRDILNQTNEALAEACPAFLSELKLTEFTLGSEPPVVIGVRTFRDTTLDQIHLDVNMTFVPKQTVSSVIVPTGSRSLLEYSSKIVLEAKIGASYVGVPIPVMLKDVCVEIKARFQFRLITIPPVIKLVEIYLRELPVIDFVLRPLKAVDLMDLPGLSDWIKSTINSSVGGLVIDPNRIRLDVQRMMDVNQYQDCMGILKVVVYKTAFSNPRGYFGAASYVEISLDDDSQRTKASKGEQNLEWHQGSNFIVRRWQTNDLERIRNMKLTLNVYEEGTLQKDQLLGVGQVPSLEKYLGESQTNQIFDQWQSFVADTGEIGGGIYYGIGYFPVVEKGRRAGILRLNVQKAENLKRVGAATRPFDVFAEMSILQGTSSLWSTRTDTKKGTNYPLWDCNNEIFISDVQDRDKVLAINVKEEEGTISGLFTDGLIGGMRIPLIELLEGKQQVFDLNDSTGQIVVLSGFYPVSDQCRDQVSPSPAASVGCLRLEIVEARNILFLQEGGIIENVASVPSKTSQFHVRVSLDGELLLETRSVDQEINPVFLDRMFKLVPSLGRELTFEMFLETTFSKDVFVGGFTARLGDVCSTDRWCPMVNRAGKTVCDLHFVTCYYPLEPMSSSKVRCGDSDTGILRIQVVEVAGATKWPNCPMILEASVHEDPVQTQTACVADGNMKAPMEFVIMDYSRAFKLLLELKAGDQETSFGMDLKDIFLGRGETATWLCSSSNDQIKLWVDYTPLEYDSKTVPMILDLKLSRGIGLKSERVELPDPFVNVRINNTRIQRTRAIKGTRSPEWNEHFLIPLPDVQSSALVLECMDWNSMDSTKPLGWKSMVLAPLAQRMVPGQMVVELDGMENGKLVMEMVFAKTDAQGLKNLEPSTFPLKPLGTCGCITKWFRCNEPGDKQPDPNPLPQSKYRVELFELLHLQKSFKTLQYKGLRLYVRILVGKIVVHRTKPVRVEDDTGSVITWPAFDLELDVVDLMFEVRAKNFFRDTKILQYDLDNADDTEMWLEPQQKKSAKQLKNHTRLHMKMTKV